MVFFFLSINLLKFVWRIVIQMYIIIISRLCFLNGSAQIQKSIIRKLYFNINEPILDLALF